MHAEINELNTFHRLFNMLDSNLAFTLSCDLDLNMYKSDNGLCMQTQKRQTL